MNEEYKMIDAEQIKDEKYNVRGSINDEAFMELVRSIGKLGILQPIIVQHDGEGYNVVAGHRRLAAAKHQKIEKVPCKVIDNLGTGAWDVSFAENLVRLDLSPIETAAAVLDCLESNAYDVETLARVMNRSMAWITQQIEICEWPIEVAQAVHNGKLSVAAASNLVRIGDKDQRKMLTAYAVENGATARITAAWLQAYRAGITTEEPGDIEPAPGCPSQPQMQPYIPCVICDKKLMMKDMRYLPTCDQCQQMVISTIRAAARADRESQGGG